MATDVLILAREIQCPVRRADMTKLLRMINRQSDRLHTARKAARAIEDNGFVSPWTHRQIKEMERAGELELVEHRALPMGREHTEMPGGSPTSLRTD